MLDTDGKVLNKKEVQFIVALIVGWIERQIGLIKL